VEGEGCPLLLQAVALRRRQWSILCEPPQIARRTRGGLPKARVVESSKQNDQGGQRDKADVVSRTKSEHSYSQGAPNGPCFTGATARNPDHEEMSALRPLQRC
jgi:hypothetical protein